MYAQLPLPCLSSEVVLCGDIPLDQAAIIESRRLAGRRKCELVGHSLHLVRMSPCQLGFNKNKNKRRKKKKGEEKTGVGADGEGQAHDIG